MSEPRYVLLAIVITLLAIAFAVWMPNLSLVSKAVTSPTMTFSQRANLLTSLLGGFQTNFSALSRITTIMSAILIGTQSSLLLYYLRQSTQIQKEIGVSFAGIVTSVLGVGCATCGSVVLASLIGLGATSTILGFLPFKGQEFSFIGIGILLAAIGFTIKKINQPFNCDIKLKSSLEAE